MPKKEHPAIAELRVILDVGDDPFAPALSLARLREGQFTRWMERWLTAGAAETKVMKSHAVNEAVRSQYLNKVRQHAALQAAQYGVEITLAKEDRSFEYYNAHIVALRAEPKEE